MPHNLTVQVLNYAGKPEKGVLVKINVDGGWFKGGELEPSISDYAGLAHFTTADDYDSWCKVHITSRGKYFGPFEIGGGSYTINI